MAEHSDVVTLVPSKTDADTAAAIKQGVALAIEPLLKVLTEAQCDGFVVQFAIGPGPLGKPAFTSIKVIKEF